MCSTSGVRAGRMMAAMFVIYIAVRCRLQPHLGPALKEEERNVPMAEKLRLLRAGILPIAIFATMMVPFINGWTSLVESSAIGAMTAFVAAVFPLLIKRKTVAEKEQRKKAREETL